jgi:hypothetical protein
VENVFIRSNPALVEISAIASWGPIPSDYLAIQLDDNPVLKSLVGIDGPLAAAADVAGANVGVQVTKAPQLASLAGLEPMTHGSLWLQGLPKVPDLLPLASLTQGNNITLFGLPAVKNLQGLHNLVTTDWLMIGDCINEKPGSPGMDGLVDLSGLDSLTTANSLSIASSSTFIGTAGRGSGGCAYHRPSYSCQVSNRRAPVRSIVFAQTTSAAPLPSRSALG